MNVIKKDGRIQEFNLEKIRLSIQRASDDMKTPLNEADLNSIINKIDRGLVDKNKHTIEYKEIHNKVVGTLNKFRFSELADFYDKAGKL